VDPVNLREIQRPLRKAYREEPERAKVTLRARGSQLDGNLMACSVDIGRALVAAQAHPGVGGPGTGACSGDLLLAGLAGCAQITAQLVAEAVGLRWRWLEVHVEGDLDLRGTLGVSQDVPVGFTGIRLRIEIDSDASAEELEAFQRKVEQYSVVLATLRQPPEIETSLVRVAAPAEARPGA